MTYNSFKEEAALPKQQKKVNSKKASLALLLKNNIVRRKKALSSNNAVCYNRIPLEPTGGPNTEANEQSQPQHMCIKNNQ